MDAMEGGQAVVCDIPGIFLQASWPEDDDFYLKFESLMVKIIFKADPSYEKCVLNNKLLVRKGSMKNSPRQCTGHS